MVRTGFKWRWAYLPVILVMGLIWYEFWASGTFKRESAPSPETPQNVEQQAGQASAPAAAVPTPAAPEPPPKPLDPFDQLLKDPPPISLSIKTATLAQTVAALNRELACDVPMTLSGGGQDNRLINLELKDQPFWDVFQAIEAQSPFDAQDGGRGLVLRQGQPIRNFERKGPAILYATQFAYTRSIPGQARPGDAQPPRMQLTVLALVDPRVHVVRHTPVQILEGIDDLGQTIDPGNNGGNWQQNETNCWQQTLTWNAPEKPAKRMTKIQCMYQFTAQGGESEASVEDIENKKDQVFDFGDRSFRLARGEVTNSRLWIQVTPIDDQPLPGKWSMKVTDGKGANVGVIQGFNGQIAATAGPYKLTLTGPRLKDVAVSFTLADVPLP